MIRSTLPILVAGAVVIGGLWFVSALATLEVDVVRVEGDLTKAEIRQVRDAVTAELRRPGIHAAADVVAAVEALGWVRGARARRYWPDMMHVAVARETLGARWGDDAWLTTSGDVVRAPTTPGERLRADLPVLHASLADGRRAMAVFNLLNEPAQTAGLRIARLDEDAAGNWTVTVRALGAESPAAAHDIETVLGATALSERFERFAAVYRAELRTATADIERVDARYDTGVAVRWNRFPDAAEPRPPLVTASSLQLAAIAPASPSPADE